MQAQEPGVSALFMQVLSMQASEAETPLHLSSQEGHVGGQRRCHEHMQFNSLLKMDEGTPTRPGHARGSPLHY